MRNLTGGCGPVSSVVVLMVLLAAAVVSPQNAQAIRPAASIQINEGGVAPEDIPDAFRSRIYRNPGEEQPTPDVLVLKNGRRI